MRAALRGEGLEMGGIIRNERGEWVRGYYGRVHRCQAPEGELQAINTGMQIVKMINGRHIEVESDSLTAVSLLNGPRDLSHPLAPIV